jgi:hypothetical protein
MNRGLFTPFKTRGEGAATKEQPNSINCQNGRFCGGFVVLRAWFGGGQALVTQGLVAPEPFGPHLRKPFESMWKRTPL